MKVSSPTDLILTHKRASHFCFDFGVSLNLLHLYSRLKRLCLRLFFLIHLLFLTFLILIALNHDQFFQIFQGYPRRAISKTCTIGQLVKDWSIKKLTILRQISH